LTGYGIHGNFGKKFRMKKSYYLIFLFSLLFHLTPYSQGVGIYSSTRQTGITYSSISLTGNPVPSWRGGTNTNDNRSFPVYLGFTFNYLGMPYTQLSISLNGFIDFSSSSATGVTPGPYSSDNSTFSQSPNGTYSAIAPLYDDLACASGATLSNSIRYRTTGATGNKVFTVEWINMTLSPGITAHLNFQVKLYEVDSKIEFIYGTMTTGSGSPSYTCGINGSTVSNPPQSSQLLSQQSPNSILFNNNPQNSLAIVPETNSMIVLTGCLLPLPAGTITGLTSVCEGTTGLTYSVGPIIGATGYVWSLPTNFILTSNPDSNSILVTIDNGAVSGVITVSGTNSCGIGIPSFLNVTVKPSPTPTIIGPSPVCIGATGQTYNTQTGMTNYQWTVSSGGTITAGGTSTSSSVTVTWNNTSTQYVSVNYNGSNGCPGSVPATFPVTINPSPPPTPVITGPDTVCLNTTGHGYKTESGMTNYTWEVSSGGTITSGAGTDSITVTWTGLAPQTVSVNYFNAYSCSANSPTVLNVTMSPLPVPVITGTAGTCIGIGGYIYTTESGMTDYNWTISAGGTITAGTGTNAITVTWNALGPQTVGVGYTNANGCASANPTVKNITVNAIPTPVITGNNEPCVNSGNHSYTTQTGMLNYLWATSSAGIIMSGAGTSQIMVNWVSSGPQWVSVNYSNSSGCQAAAPTTYNVNVNSIPSAAGIITGTPSLCAPANGIAYYVDPILNANTYVWSPPPGATIQSGSGTNSITVNFSSTASSGNISVSGANSCGSGPYSPPYFISVTSFLPTPFIQQGGDWVYSDQLNFNQWYYEGTPIPGATGQFYLATEDGWYFDIAMNNSCISDTSNWIYIIITGKEEQEMGNITLYPVPNDGRFTIAFNFFGEESYTLSIYNSLGQKIKEMKDIRLNGKTELFIEIPSARHGIYSVVFQNGTNRVVKKILVTQ